MLFSTLILFNRNVDQDKKFSWKSRGTFTIFLWKKLLFYPTFHFIIAQQVHYLLSRTAGEEKSIQIKLIDNHTTLKPTRFPTDLILWNDQLKRI